MVRGLGHVRNSRGSPRLQSLSYYTRVSSTIPDHGRRKPQQARAAQRRSTFLELAGRLIGDVGYDGVTMTAVAQRAGASIGTLYDYFPDKQSLAQALAAQYAEEADEHWTRLLHGAQISEESDLANLFIEGALTFARERPAYLLLLGAPHIVPRSQAERKHLRNTFADALRRFYPALTAEKAFHRALVIIELMKALFAVLKQVVPRDRETVIIEFKRLVGFYLSISVEQPLQGLVGAGPSDDELPPRR